MSLARPFPRPTLTLPDWRRALRPFRALGDAYGTARSRIADARAAEAGVRTLLDDLAPDWVEHLDDAYVYGANGQETWTRTLVIRSWPATVKPGRWASVLFDLGGEIDLTLAQHSHRIPLKDAKRRLRTQRVVQQSVQQARAERGALEDFDELADLGSATRLAQQVTDKAESLFAVDVALLVRAPSREALDAATARVQERLEEMDFACGGMRWQQAAGFRSAGTVYATPALNRAVTTDTTTLAFSLPFLTTDIGTGSGPLWGITTADRAPLRYDPYAREQGIPAPHVALIGPTGAGKTTCFLTVLCEYLTQPDPPDAVLIDNKGDLRRVCADLGGQRVAFSAAPQHTINIMDLPPRAVAPAAADGAARENAVDEAVLNIVGFLHLACGQRTELTDEEIALAEKAALAAYASTDGGRLPILRTDPATWDRPVPTLDGLHAALRDVGATSLANRLEPYAHGALSALFGQPTTLDLAAPLVVFDLADLRVQLRTLAAYLIGAYTWRRARTRPRRLIFGMDDVVRLLAHETTARLVADIYALGRSFGVSAWTMAQSRLDYSGTLEGQRVLENCHTTFTVSGVGEGTLETPRGSAAVKILPCETVLGWLPIPAA